MVFAVVAENSTREPTGWWLPASAWPCRPTAAPTATSASIIRSAKTEHVAGDYAEELAAEMLATTLDVEFDPDKSWDEKKEVYRMSNKIVRTANITQSAVGDKRRDLWTT